jgi:serine/threonine-protein kinase
MDEGRFLPGVLVAGRYRIVALLGRGGMGEVYRANDLAVGQQVALKFLSAETASNDAARGRFQNEVRIARQVSHPNVCRVYDLGEVEGQLYLSMEYVDGEDLGSLLRRIGRLPSDKALEIARQLCAGLAAAHDKGVLHRDLKPANIMLNGRGEALITDFGLAAVADQVQSSEVRHGTPAYMAPEQLAGREVSVKSDLYGLGLVLYELFTGKRAFEAQTLAELVRMQSEAAPAKLSSVVRDLDPAVERVILRCLDPEPAGRPSSALAVAAALPGGDPLAAALAAGETPSPQMVAAAGGAAGLSPSVAIPCLAAVALAILGAVLVIGNTGLFARAHLDLPPDALASKARETAQRLGYTTPPVDSASGFYTAGEYWDWVERNDKPRPRWNQVLDGRPTPVRFWYRESPRYLVRHTYTGQFATAIVSPDDPPVTLSRMVNVELDTRGRLTFFLAIPPQRDAPEPPQAAAVDWNALFAAAGLDPARFQPVPPTWNPPAAYDAHAAWTGVWPDSPNRPLRIEAAAWRGKPVSFQMIGPWTKPDRMEEQPRSAGRKATDILAEMLALAVLGGAALLARRNYARGRGDPRGSLRLAGFVFCLQMAVWVCAGHMVPEFSTFVMFLLACAGGLLLAGLVWLLYMALEPYVRRRWPQAIISWSRLLAGRFRDPLVGRDILFGTVLGAAWVMIFLARYAIGQRLGSPPWQGPAVALGGFRRVLGATLSQGPATVQSTLLFFMMIFLLRWLLRRQWLASVGFVLIWVALQTLTSTEPVLDGIAFTAVYGVAAVVLVRFGFLAMAVGILVADSLLQAPYTTDFSAWFAPVSLFTIAWVLALAVYGFHTALAGRRLFREEMFE